MTEVLFFAELICISRQKAVPLCADKKVMIYELTQIICQTKTEIYPDLSGRGDLKQHRVKPYESAATLLR